MGRNDQAWRPTHPEVLEELIQKRLAQPVTVINSGIAGLRVQNTAFRLEHELLRFKPDVAVVYHGVNNIRSCIGADFRFRPRGSLLLQQALFLDAKSSRETHGDRAGEFRFWQGLQRIVDLCAKNEIKLCLCTFAPAFDENTPQRLLEFYSRIMPLYGDQRAQHALEAIRAHNRIVFDVAEEHGIEVIDIESVLGGQYEHFIDFCHFHQSGRDILAREVGRSILNWIERDQPLQIPETAQQSVNDENQSTLSSGTPSLER